MAMTAAAFLCGLVFGAGLMISGMAQPAKVLNFLDIAGSWDASLLFVMAAALAVSSLGYVLARRRAQPLFAAQSLWPASSVIDPALIYGAVVFGVGWGLVGLCPGPALVGLATLSPPLIVFVLAMLAGMALHDEWRRRRTRAEAPANAEG